MELEPGPPFSHRTVGRDAASSRSKQAAVLVTRLLAAGASPFFFLPDGDGPLHWAIRRDSFECLNNTPFYRHQKVVIILILS